MVKKYWLNKYQYIAEVNGRLAVVTLDEKGEIVRVAIFGEERKNNG